MKILRKVKCSDRLPDKEGIYHGINKEGKPNVFIYNKDVENIIIDRVKYWYEEVDLELKSEEILPENYRLTKKIIESLEHNCKTMLNFEYKQKLLYYKALEVAELEIVELKVSKSVVKDNKKYIENTVLKKFTEDNKRLSKGAKERYEKAYNYYEENVFDKSIQGSLYYTEIDKALKIAAGL